MTAADDQGAGNRPPDPLQLQLIEGPAAGQSLPLRSRFETTLRVGRTKASNIHIKDASVSERHGVLTWTPDGWRLSDSGSSNGTAVNGERLDSEGPGRILKDGDIVRFGGETKARVEIVLFADEDITVEQYLEAECSRLIHRIKGRCEQHSNRIASDWRGQRLQLEALMS